MIRPIRALLIPAVLLGGVTACPPANPDIDVLVRTSTGEPVSGVFVEIADRHGAYAHQDTTLADGRTGRSLPHKGLWVVRLLSAPTYRIPDQENPVRVRLGDYQHGRVQFVVEPL